MGNSALSLPISCMACFGQLSTSFTHFKQCTNWATHRLLPGIYLPHFMHGILWAIKATLYPFQTRYTLGNSAPSLPISCMACFGQFSTSFTHFRQRTNWATHRLLPGIYLPHFMHGILWAIKATFYPFHALPDVGNSAPLLPIVSANLNGKGHYVASLVMLPVSRYTPPAFSIFFNIPCIPRP